MEGMHIIDTHTHGYFADYDGARDDMILRARDAGVMAQIQIGCDEISTFAAVKLARENDDFFCTLGLHPSDVDKFENPKVYRIAGFENFEKKAKNVHQLFEIFEDLYAKNKDKIVGMGETGFDRYHDAGNEIYELQKEAFLRHTLFAKKHNLPLVIHSRNSTSELLDFLETNIKPGEVPGVVHCFSEDTEAAKIFTQKYGFFLGIGGIITYGNADTLREAVKQTPIEFLVTETDAPFLPPRKFRKTNSVNEPSSLLEVVEKISEIKNIPVEETANILVENAKRLFKI